MSRAAFAFVALACLSLLGRVDAAPSNGDAVPPENVVKQIDRLAPRQPGVTNLYAIVLGGDGSEDVFQREVKVVQDRLEERFGAFGHIVTLVNNRRSQQPEATRHSLWYAIRRVSERMDKEQDLLFVHLTSHGAANHQLVLRHPSQDLYWLGKKDLADMLGLSGVRHRFILISGCYSGGFIPGLANENTVVVSASASTVTSYGCGDKSEITDFSRVFYTRALTRSRSLAEAARVAIQYVHEEEVRAHRGHSYPQASVGIRMDEYLRQLDVQKLH